jgi:ribose 5-phosphate isomerase B
MAQKIFLGADHAGLPLKNQIKQFLQEEQSQFTVEDLGTSSEASVHYPDFAKAVASEVSKGKGIGILICGSGIGMAIAANKIKGIRAATIWDATSGRLCREHNDANIICLGSRFTGVETAKDAVKAWLGATFQKGRHGERVAKISELENDK